MFYRQLQPPLIPPGPHRQGECGGEPCGGMATPLGELPQRRLDSGHAKVATQRPVLPVEVTWRRNGKGTHRRDVTMLPARQEIPRRLRRTTLGVEHQVS